MRIMETVTGGYATPSALLLSTNTKRDGARFLEQNRIHFWISTK
jgi:hypothetical protein